MFQPGLFHFPRHLNAWMVLTPTSQGPCYQTYSTVTRMGLGSPTEHQFARLRLLRLVQGWLVLALLQDILTFPQHSLVRPSPGGAQDPVVAPWIFLWSPCSCHSHLCFMFFPSSWLVLELLEGRCGCLTSTGTMWMLRCSFPGADWGGKGIPPTN